MSTEQQGFACVMDAIPSDERAHHMAVGSQLLGSVEAIQERADGYAFRLSANNNTLAQLAEFIRNERLCCPFFTFTVQVEAHAGPIWLLLTGSEGIKEFILAEMGDYLNPTVVAAAGIR